MNDTPDPTPDPARPALRIVHGSPTDVEIAVLTAVMAASAGDGDRPASRVRRGGWNDPGAQHRRVPVPGPNAWRAAYLP